MRSSYCFENVVLGNFLLGLVYYISLTGVGLIYSLDRVYLGLYSLRNDTMRK